MRAARSPDKEAQYHRAEAVVLTSPKFNYGLFGVSRPDRY
jgi:hypothetical protein